MKTRSGHIKRQLIDLDRAKRLDFHSEDPELEDLAIHLAYELIDGDRDGDEDRVSAAKEVISADSRLISKVARALRAEHAFDLERDVKSLYINEAVRRCVRSVLSS